MDKTLAFTKAALLTPIHQRNAANVIESGLH